MAHDPDDEVTVISAEGIGRGVLRGNTIEVVKMEKRVEHIDATPGRDEIDRIVYLIQSMWKNGEQSRAFDILQAGWPQMKVAQAIRLLRAEINIGQAFDDYEV